MLHHRNGDTTQRCWRQRAGLGIVTKPEKKTKNRPTTPPQRLQKTSLPIPNPPHTVAAAAAASSSAGMLGSFKLSFGYCTIAPSCRVAVSTLPAAVTWFRFPGFLKN